jgi:hypothetical protein
MRPQEHSLPMCNWIEARTRTSCLTDVFGITGAKVRRQQSCSFKYEGYTSHKHGRWFFLTAKDVVLCYTSAGF